jgi:hypothetical protein
MKLIKADHDRRLEIPGVPNLVRRPVDIDKSQTGFSSLRSLRIYRFEADSVINGHAEEDEVFIVVLAGSAELAMSMHNSQEIPHSFILSAANDLQRSSCAAYLPPHAAYRLTLKGDADVAYARATPAVGRPPTVFNTNVRSQAGGISVLFEEATYAQRLRLGLVEINATRDEIAFPPIEKTEDKFEALVHIRTLSVECAATIAGGEATPITLESWETVAVSPGECPTLKLAKGSSALVLVVLAA